MSSLLFRQAMAAYALEPPAEVIQDGNIHRFAVPGDKNNSKNGWYVFHGDAGAFGCWKRGIQQSWYNKDLAKVTNEEKWKLQADFKKLEELRKAEKKRKSQEAKVLAIEVWNRATDPISHPYLKNKSILPLGIRAGVNNRLIIPLINIERKIQGLQYIFEDGSKKFLTGTEVKGNFYPINQYLPEITDKIYICEGFATGATLYGILKGAIMVAFSCLNILPVARNLQILYPRAQIIIAADNDRFTDGNPGLKAANHAAKEVRGTVVYPIFKTGMLNDKRTDFNDLMTSEGPEAVAALFGKTQNSNQLEVVCLDDVVPEPINWLWPGKLALGKVCMIAGEPGLGKSQITASVASIVSKGGVWPASSDFCQMGKVIILSAEDDLKDTIKPRLIACEANHKNIFAIEAMVDLNKDIEHIKNVLALYPETKLVIIDPITAYMGEIDSHNNTEVRKMMGDLTKMAATHNVCVLLITHLNKDNQKKAINRVIGSIGFVAAVRCAYGVTRDPNDEHRRLFLCIKNNIAIDNLGLAYNIESVDLPNNIITSRVWWHNESIVDDINNSMGEGHRSNKTSNELARECRIFLKNNLEESSKTVEELKELAKKADIPFNSLRKFKYELKIKSVRTGYGASSSSRWEWPLNPPIFPEMED